jgi:hypothetical protein
MREVMQTMKTQDQFEKSCGMQARPTPAAR